MILEIFNVVVLLVSFFTIRQLKQDIKTCQKALKKEKERYWDAYNYNVEISDRYKREISHLEAKLKAFTSCWLYTTRS